MVLEVELVQMHQVERVRGLLGRVGDALVVQLDGLTHSRVVLDDRGEEGERGRGRLGGREVLAEELDAIRLAQRLREQPPDRLVLRLGDHEAQIDLESVLRLPEIESCLPIGEQHLLVLLVGGEQLLEHAAALLAHPRFEQAQPEGDLDGAPLLGARRRHERESLPQRLHRLLLVVDEYMRLRQLEARLHVLGRRLGRQPEPLERALGALVVQLDLAELARDGDELGGKRRATHARALQRREHLLPDLGGPLELLGLERRVGRLEDGRERLLELVVRRRRRARRRRRVRACHRRCGRDDRRRGRSLAGRKEVAAVTGHVRDARTRADGHAVLGRQRDFHRLQLGRRRVG